MLTGANFVRYGLFRRMTGVGKQGEVARPEVILEGTSDGVSWREFNFLYKPGNVYRAPPFIGNETCFVYALIRFCSPSPTPAGLAGFITSRVLCGLCVHRWIVWNSIDGLYGIASGERNRISVMETDVSRCGLQRLELIHKILGLCT